jgi:hypothetical protein
MPVGRAPEKNASSASFHCGEWVRRVNGVRASAMYRVADSNQQQRRKRRDGVLLHRIIRAPDDLHQDEQDDVEGAHLSDGEAAAGK